MTTNQSQQLVKNPKTKAAMTILAKFADTEFKYKLAKTQAEEATAYIKEAMIAAGVPKIEIDLPGLTGYITLAERTNYRVEDIERISPEYLKKALDTEKVKAQAVLTGELPAGVAESKTQYITKKFKAVE